MKRVILLLILSQCQLAQAASLTGVLEVDHVNWLNGKTQGEYITTSYWQLAQTQPTRSWVPGLYAKGQAKEVVLSHGQDKVTTVIDVSGLEYKLGSAASKFELQPFVLASVPTCDTQSNSQSSLLLVGNNPRCIGKDSYVTKDKHQYTPFQFFRPIFKLPNMVADFASAKLPSGTYHGSVTVTAQYLYESATGNLTYRSFPISISFSIRYVKSKVTSVIVNGNGNMPAVYDVDNKTVSGTTDYRINVKGVFSNGVQLTFAHSPAGQDFNLESNLGDTKIPYSIKCPQCNVPNVVDKGKLSLNNGTTKVPGKGDSISFSLKVSYDNIAAKTVDTRSYKDTFTVLFKPVL
ncbi:hypothetical protein [Shewanella violacea]|nr:hypothetical protein [Shewanella violacea]